MQQHPLREQLIHDLHARPFITLDAPLSLLHLAMVHGDDDRGDARDRLAALCRQHGVELPEGAGNHVRVRIADTWLKWEQHAEFITWTFWRSRPLAEPFNALTAGFAALMAAGSPGPACWTPQRWWRTIRDPLRRKAT